MAQANENYKRLQLFSFLSYAYLVAILKINSQIILFDELFTTNKQVHKLWCTLTNIFSSEI